MVKRILLAVIVGGVSIAVSVQPSWTRELPRQSIVHGRRFQPRDDDLRALGYPDVTALQAVEIDRLYRELLHCEGAGTDAHGAC